MTNEELNDRRNHHFSQRDRHNPKSSLPKLKSFRDLAILKETIRDEEDKNTVREAKVAEPDRSANRLVRGTQNSHRKGVPSVSEFSGSVVLGPGGAPKGGSSDTQRDAQESGVYHEQPGTTGERGRTDGGGDERSNVTGLDLEQHNVAFYVYEELTRTGDDERFTSLSMWERLGLPPDREDAVSAALSAARHRGGIKALGRLKGSRYYVYMIDNRSKIHDFEHRIEGPVRRATGQTRQPGLKRNKLQLGEVSLTEPSVVDPTNYSSVEQRVMDHYAADTLDQVTEFHRSMENIAKGLPDVLRALSKALHAARIDILKGYTTTELLIELQRRERSKS